MSNNLTDKDKQFAEAFAGLYISTIDMTKNDIEFGYKRVEMWEDIKKLHMDMEPLKLFKKKHKEWENRLEEIKSCIFNIYCGIGESIEDLNKLTIK